MGKVEVKGKEYEAESILISRNKDFIKAKEKEKAIENGTAKPEYKYLIIIKLFKIDEPQVTTEMPLVELDFYDIERTKIMNFEDVDFLTLGSDLLINKINNVEIKITGDILNIINNK